MTPFVRDTIKWMGAADLDPTQFYWFDISNAIQNTDRADVEPLMTHRPPFDQCFVVWQGATRNYPHYETLMMVKGQDPEEGIVVTVWKGPAGQMPMGFAPMVYLIDEGMLRYGSVEEGDTIEKDVAELILALVGSWYRAMDKRIEAHYPEVKPTFTNRRKIAQGKQPTYAWRTVIIEPKQARSTGLGGTHASPRLHDRRGHLRRLRSGKNVWVKPCKVGKAELGTVFHDYEVRA